MASSSDPMGSTTNWKERMTAVLKENLYERILGIFQDPVLHFARNPEVHGRLLSYIRSWAEKFLNESTDQKEYVQKISRQIYLVFAQFEVNLVPKALAEAAKPKGYRIWASTTQTVESMGSLERMMHELQVKSKSETLEQQAGTSLQLASTAPHQCSTSQQQLLVMQRTGDFCTNEDVNLPPKKLVREIFEDDARQSRVDLDIEKWRLHYAKREVPYPKYQLRILIQSFVAIMVKSLLSQDMDQSQNDEDMRLTSRVREVIKQYLPEELDENFLEYLKIEA